MSSADNELTTLLAVLALVKALRRRKPKGGQMSLRAISAELAADP